jgi:TPR repeat protein
MSLKYDFHDFRWRAESKYLKIRVRTFCDALRTNSIMTCMGFKIILLPLLVSILLPADCLFAQVPAAMLKLPPNMPAKLKLLHKKVWDGDVHSFEQLGEAYLFGRGVTKNEQLARWLFLQAADQNDPAAQTFLGTMHCQGTGNLPPDPLGGTAWFHVAADQNYPEAQTDLGVQYLRGEGVPHNRAYGAGWIERAANQGFPGAQAILGILYVEGEGVPKDYQKALLWLLKANKQDDAKAQYHLGQLYLSGNGLPVDYAKAFAFTRKAAGQDFASAEYQMGDFYRLGLGRKRDIGQAIVWYQKTEALRNCDNQDRNGTTSTAMVWPKQPVDED